MAPLFLMVFILILKNRNRKNYRFRQKKGKGKEYDISNDKKEKYRRGKAQKWSNLTKQLIKEYTFAIFQAMVG